MPSTKPTRDARRVGLLDRHDALGADVRQRLGDDAADRPRPPWRRSSRPGRARRPRPCARRAAARPQWPRCPPRCRVEQHRVGALVERLHAFAHDRLSEQRRRRGAVARLIGGLVGDLADELRAHVLVLVDELDLARDRHAVVGDRRSAGEPFQYDVAPLRAQGHLDRVGQFVHARLQQQTSLVIEVEALAHGVVALLGRDEDAAALQPSIVQIGHRVIDGVERVLRGVERDLALRGQRHQVLEIDVGPDEVPDEGDLARDDVDRRDVDVLAVADDVVEAAVLHHGDAVLDRALLADEVDDRVGAQAVGELLARGRAACRRPGPDGRRRAPWRVPGPSQTGRRR